MLSAAQPAEHTTVRVMATTDGSGNGSSQKYVFSIAGLLHNYCVNWRKQMCCVYAFTPPTPHKNVNLAIDRGENSERQSTMAAASYVSFHVYLCSSL